MGIGHEQTFTIGPQRVVLTVRDVAVGLCDPSCGDLIDLELALTPLSDSEQMPRVLDYE
jgi:hypothetical protein